MRKKAIDVLYFIEKYFGGNVIGAYSTDYLIRRLEV